MLMSSVIEAEPPEIYLMSCLMKPFTEATVMTSLTTLADKELVYMVSWAKKIPGNEVTCLGCGIFVNSKQYMLKIKPLLYK